MTSDFTKLPRLYTNQALQSNALISLDRPQAHYLKTVLRRVAGDQFRVFNGADGEWLAELTQLGKKDAQAIAMSKIKDQPKTAPQIHLLFSPIKKSRMDFLIEKSVELGVTDLRPIITARSETRKIKAERIQAQIIEASEQCERLSLPKPHDIEKLEQTVQKWDKNIPLYACLERTEAKPLSQIIQPGSGAFLIGPEGGFSPDEIEFLNAQNHIAPVSLGAHILRSETAALVCLSLNSIYKK